MDHAKENNEFKKFFPKMKDDRYQYLGHLGKGRSGQVFSARDKLLKKDIVIKVLCSEIPKKEDFQRFQREARAFSSLQHPNILRVLDFGLAEDQTPYLVTDYIDGVTVSDYQKKHKLFSMEDTIKIGIQVCDAMAHSHNRGVLHRDLKPSNILLTNIDAKKKHVFILDFGLAKFTDNHPTKDHTLTRPGQILGTAEYMCPEQAKGGKCDERSDIYALGCILFEMVSGKPPFIAPALLEVIRMQCEELPPLEKIEALGNKLNLAPVLEKALEKDPENRYASMGEMGDALKELIEPVVVKESAVKNQKRKDEDDSASESSPDAQEDMAGSITSQPSRKLKRLPVIAICILLAISASLILINLLRNGSTIDVGEIKEKKPVTTKKVVREENLVKDAMILSGSMNGTHLTLAGTIGTDELLSDAAKSGKRITLVDASRAHMTDRGLPFIRNISPETLILSGTSITDQGMLRLQKDISLRNLVIDDTATINGTCFKIMPTINNLQVLVIGGNKLTSRMFSPLTNCQKLQALCINSSPNLGDEIFLFISRIPNLNTLYIGDCQELSAEAINKLKESKPFVRTIVSERPIPIEQIAELKGTLTGKDDYGFLD